MLIAKATTDPDHHPRGGISSPRVPSPLRPFGKMESTSFHTYLMYTMLTELTPYVDFTKIDWAP